MPINFPPNDSKMKNGTTTRKSGEYQEGGREWERERVGADFMS
jgi:hypothetical protein